MKTFFSANTVSLTAQAQSLGTLAGIFHLAMVLRDSVFDNQTAENFKESAEAKYHGTHNLDAATRKLCVGDALKWYSTRCILCCMYNIIYFS